MRKIYTNITIPADKRRLSFLDKAGIRYQLKVDATRSEYPYFTFSEICLIKDEDYERALILISQINRQ